MLRIIEDNRSYRMIEDDNGVYFCHYKSKAAFRHNLSNYNEFPCDSKCHGPFSMGDPDSSLFLYYNDGTHYNGEEQVPSIRGREIENGYIGTPCGDEFYGGIWKITYNKDLECYFVREISESYEDEVDAYVNGEILPH